MAPKLTVRPREIQKTMGATLFIEAQRKEMSEYPVIYELEWNLP
jgi:hypothetical protein